MFIGTGAAALGVGTAGWIASWTLRFTVVPRCQREPCFVGQAAGVMSGFALAATGAGLLSYGLARRGARRRGAARAPFQIVPAMGVGHTGLTVAGRF